MPLECIIPPSGKGLRSDFVTGFVLMEMSYALTYHSRGRCIATLIVMCVLNNRLFTVSKITEGTQCSPEIYSCCYASYTTFQI
jgi:hypothetical protein